MKAIDFPDFNLIYEFNEGKFKETRNPLYVWATILACCKDKDSFPEWVLNYLQDVGGKLLEITSPHGEASYLVKNALGFYYGKYFSQYHKPRIKEKVFNRVIEERLKRKHGQKTEIFNDIGGEFELSEDTIKKYFYEVKKEHQANLEIYKEIEREENNRNRK